MSNDGTDGPVPIKGLPSDNPKQPPMRMELRDMIKTRPKQFELYLLGMERFQNETRKNERNPLSYFQICGIHGAPYVPWPDEKWNNKTPMWYRDMDQPHRELHKATPPAKPKYRQLEGYCTHSSVLFLPWHRPFLALFEAELYKHVNFVANSFDSTQGKDDYVKEAKDFRMPFWDWALPQDDTPTIFPREVQPDYYHPVLRPQKGTTKVPMRPNPLSGYTFGDLGKQVDILNWYMDNGRSYTTYRKDAASIGTGLAKLYSDAGFQKGLNLTERVLYLLKSYPSFGPMSFDRVNVKTQGFLNWGSLEDIHNSVHGYVGGYMGNPQVAAFDPVFWLHHTNIDRLFSIWQALHDDPGKKDTYVEAEINEQGNYVTPSGAPEDATTPLYPFNRSKDPADIFNSERARNTKDFGYVYPETRDWLFGSAPKVEEQLDKLYRKGSLANTLNSAGESRDASKRGLQDRALSLKQFNNSDLTTEKIMDAVNDGKTSLPATIVNQMANIQIPKERHLGDLVHNKKYFEWLVNVKAEKHALGGDFVVHFFLGDPPPEQNSQNYENDMNHVAAFFTFGQTEDSGCPKCRGDRAQKLQVSGQVPLTIALVERYLAGQINSLNVNDVVPYLQKNFHWRTTNKKRNAIDRSSITGLLVGIVTNEVSLDDPSGRPKYSPTVVPRPEATTNENGGARGDGTGNTRTSLG